MNITAVSLICTIEHRNPSPLISVYIEKINFFLYFTLGKVWLGYNECRIGPKGLGRNRLAQLGSLHGLFIEKKRKKQPRLFNLFKIRDIGSKAPANVTY